ncbi:diphosphate--fructose-6-phosphate 1-phosphotransferase [Salvia divinorum]|uniref:Diphosphate--fructose-6-phosphate 1-phosphotransferase n=1 Tax=Salvia divinorum TaxID=28513 RepID=A0ABD1GR14_SALDI
MNSWRNRNFQNQDESVMQKSGAPHLDDKDRPSETCFDVFGAENRKPNYGTIIIDEMLQLKESCSSFHNHDYIEKIKEFQSYVDMVKRFTRPGCSAETLDVALNSISSLVNTLSVMSSKQRILHASL